MSKATDAMKLVNTKHGENRIGRTTVEYQAWAGMKARCCNPKNKRYKDYGGRGIGISEVWVNDFTRFLKDVGRRPTPQHSIDRRDFNGHYVPGNVRWATKLEQARNRRNLRPLTIDGVTKLLCEWSEISGVELRTIWIRLKHGWLPSRAVWAPIRQLKRRNK